MSLPQRFPFAPRVIVALMSIVLVFIVGTTFATAQSSEPVSTGPLAVSDTTLTPGQSVQVSGGGFAPGGSIDVTLESAPVLLRTVTADAAGAFSTTVTIPVTAAPGTHALKATGPAPGGGLRVLSQTVTIAGTSSSGALVTTGAQLLPVAIVGAGAVLAGVVVLAARRRRPA